MAISKNEKIRGAVWLDPDTKTTLKISFMKNTENYIIGANVHDDPWVIKLMKKFTLADIDQMTNDFMKHSADREILFDEFYDNYKEWKRWYDVYKGGEYQQTADITSLVHIFNIAKDKEKFFKLKLEIFELDGIKMHKDRKLKSALRKSQTVPELLGHLHQAGLDLENELNEPQNEIPVQDVTNQENTQDSNLSPIEAASDVPIESSNKTE